MMNWKNEYSLLLLAGGRSRRMGQDKGKLVFEGKTFVEGLLEKGRALGIGPLFLSGAAEGNESGPGFEGVRIVPDIYPDRGPLGGMYACMSVMRTPYCLVLPVDVPQIPLAVLEELLRRHREQEEKGEGQKPLLLRHGDRVEPLIGVYPAKLAEMAGEAVKNGGARVFSLLDRCGYLCCEARVSPEWLDNINTPEAYERLLALQKDKEFSDL